LRPDLEGDAGITGRSIRHHLLIEEPKSLHGTLSAYLRKIESMSRGRKICALASHKAPEEVEEPPASCRCQLVREGRQSNGRHRRRGLPQDRRRPDVLFETDIARLLWTIT